MINSIIHDVGLTIYKYVGTALIMAVLYMFAHLYIEKIGLKETIRMWIREFRNNKRFVKVFFCAFYIFLVIGKTLLCRFVWLDPWSKFLDGWGLNDSNGELTTESIQNFVLFVPVTAMLFWVSREKLFKDKGITLLSIAWNSVKISFIFSFVIECCQFFFHLGTFQIADLVYNTGGGLTGGILYYIFYKIRRTRK